MSAYHACAVILAALEGAALSADERHFFQLHPPAGFTLFRRNLAPSYMQVKALCSDLQGLRGHGQSKMLLAIDQEGGRVARLKQPFPDGGPAMRLAEGHCDAESLQFIENHAFIVASSLLGLGLNVNFAPVLDILSNEANPSIGDRCFAQDGEQVAQRAGAYLRGLQGGGVFACLKHFPGQGDGKADTHEEGTVIDASRELLLSRELHPYRQLLATCPLVMVSHAIYPALDSSRPASLSRQVMQGLLREQFGFQGVIVTDDMNMKAITQDRQGWTEAVVTSIAAGADLVLVCREWERYQWAVEAMTREAQKSPSFAARLSDAATRVGTLRARLA